MTDSTIDQIPRMPELIGPGIVAIVEARPRAKQHITTGRWGDLVEGWRAQAALCLRQLSAEAMARSLENGSGPALREYAASDFWAELPEDPTYSVGNVTLRRTVTNTASASSGSFTAGTIPAGSKIHRDADDTSVFPVVAGDWKTTSDVQCSADDSATLDVGGGQYQHTQDIVCPVQATRTGTDCNVMPLFGDTNPAKIVSTLFDTTFTVHDIVSGGGSAKRSDEQVRAFARAMAAGLFGPTAGAAMLGALEDGRVSRIATVDDTSTATGVVYVADETWGSSAELCRQLQVVVDGTPDAAGWRGFGPRVSVRPVYNRLIKISVPVLLADPKVVQREAEISKELEAAARDYLDERPDWWSWRTNSLAAVLGGADKDILSVGSPVVTDSSTGAVLTEPSGLLSGASAVHHYLVKGGLSVTYSVPS